MYSAIEHLARSIWLGRFEWENSVAMFSAPRWSPEISGDPRWPGLGDPRGSAHFDASGTSDGNHTVLTVAGCVSSVKKWARLDVQWNKILKDAGLPDGTIFHMNRFARNLPPYQDFANQSQRKAELMSALVNCARHNVNKAFACTVVLQDWKRINEEYCIVESLGYPYALCGSTCVASVRAWARKKGGVPVEFFFESGDKHWGQLKKILKVNDDIEAMDRSKEQMVQFQAADLIAWKSRKLMMQAAAYDGPGDQDLYFSIRSSLAGINSMPHKYGVHTYETMKRLSIRAGIPRR